MAQGETSMRKHKLLIAVIMFGLTWAGIVKAEDQPIEQQLVDAMNKVFGAHPGFRANHAKGIVVEGNFKASAEAAGLSRAVLFDGSPIPATVRFSDTTGIPNIADGSSNANPHGMAIKFHLPDGSDTDMVINSLKFFPVATGEDFRDLLLALAASPPDAPKPTKFEQFAANCADSLVQKRIRTASLESNNIRVDTIGFQFRSQKANEFGGRFEPQWAR